MNNSMVVTFWGVRGSFPTPGPQTARVGGNTPCIQVQIGKHLIILDAGTGIIGLGRAMVAAHRQSGTPMTTTLLFTHTHHDHTQGFPFFIPTHFPSTRINIFGPKSLSQDLEEVLARSMSPPVFPITLEELPCERKTRNLDEGEMVVLHPDRDEPEVLRPHRDSPVLLPDAIRIRFIRSFSHPQGVFVYRIESADHTLVLATDTEGYIGGDQRIIKFAKDATLLIHDAQYTDEEYANANAPKQGWGHSTWKMAVEIAEAAGAKRLALFHHDPTHDDDTLDQIEKQARGAFPAAFLAREGMRVEV
ncbi:MAG: MBL fold metallo-hydrolase [Chloroflexi bacterium]|nr:MBL fold metallo-hydrolase [Chloroflexota bacterium]